MTTPTYSDTHGVRPMTCHVCHNEPSVGVAAVPGVPISVAYGQSCLNANAHPWWVLVRNTALIGGLHHTASWWVDMVQATCRHLGRSLAEFNTDVAAERAEMDGELDRLHERLDEDGER